MEKGVFNSVQVILAKRAGFCSGVKRAVNRLLEESAGFAKVNTLGPLVHNDDVMNYLKRYSIEVIEQPNEADGAFVALRTHGVPPAMLCDLKERGTVIIDLTCPRVSKIQQIAAGLFSSGKQVLIFGNRDHPEVKGLVGWAGDKAIVVTSITELANLSFEKPVALIAQTTADPEQYKEIKKAFEEKFPEGEVFQTICPETGLRQKEVVNLAQRVEALVVVGSKSSANTKALFDCCRQLKPSCRVTNAGELDWSFLKDFNTVGVTAGASTPPWTIKEVVESMENENLDAKQNEEQFDFAGEVKVAQVGEQVSGKVARVTAEEVYVDIGAKTEAILPVEEVHLEKGKELTELFAPEDDIEVTVLETDEQEGKVIVSHKRLAREKRLKEIEQALADDLIMEGRVKQVVQAGMVIDLGTGVEGFMPGSLVDVRFIPDFQEFKNEQIQFKILEFDRDKGKLILTRKKVIEEENASKREDILQSMEVGSTIKGVVKRLTNFGAFVDIGGIDGLVHISELSWERVGHPSEVLKVGDEIEVKVLEVIPEKERISLSIRKTQPDPWTRAVQELEGGQLITGKVTRLVNFGAFIELRPGVEGLAHISQLADYHVQHPSEILKEGEDVEVKILEIKPKAKRISLSVKEARGVTAASKEAAGNVNGEENGQVTLGDVFGELFDNEDFSKAGETAEEEVNQEPSEEKPEMAEKDSSDNEEQKEAAVEENEEAPVDKDSGIEEVASIEEESEQVKEEPADEPRGTENAETKEEETAEESDRE
ncbi:MAG: bifunctional 4-hydroxy-3-methylbut-2-enyl diphosphate reductase/30S ribosomal protein S1 [Bacillota bacterium]|nr:bifunctional 4-hydroxy-3-methylbut-2-enyl diphosphate reductase/30S ribosomal protein S1 [Bacillota bacterium]